MTDPVKHDIIRYCHLMARKGLVAGTEGNVSARAADGTIWMTPANVNKGEVEEDMLVRLDLDARQLEGERQPTSERYMHLEFYRQRPGAGGVAHGHPPFLTAYAAARRKLPRDILPELIAVIGDIALVPYGRPSSPKLAAAIAPFCRQHNVFMLQNHGAIAVGPSIRDAYHRLEVGEAYAKTCWAAQALGGVIPLGKEEIADLPSPCFG